MTGPTVQSSWSAGSWLKTTRNASSVGSSRSTRNRSRAPLASTMRCPRMLSLTSTRTPRLTGTRPSSNWEIDLGPPVLEELENRHGSRSPTSRPSTSRTVTVTCTTSTLERNTWAAASPSPHAISADHDHDGEPAGCTATHRRNPVRRPSPVPGARNVLHQGGDRRLLQDTLVHMTAAPATVSYAQRGIGRHRSWAPPSETTSGGRWSDGRTRDALVVGAQGYRASVPTSCGTRRRVWPRRSSPGVSSAGDRVGIWAPNRYEWVVTQYATAQRRGRSSSTSTLPTRRVSSPTRSPSRARDSCSCSPEGFRRTSYVGDSRLRFEATARRWTRTRSSSTTSGRRLLMEKRTLVGNDATLAAARVLADLRRPHQHSVHLGDHGACRRARRCPTTTSSTTGSSVARCSATPSPTGSASPCRSTTVSVWSSATWPARLMARAWWSPARASTPARRSPPIAAERCTSLYGVPTMFIAQLAHPDVRPDGALEPPHRCDGRLAVSRRGHAARCETRMHMPEVTICYGMTETSPVSTQTSGDDPVDKRVATVGRVHPTRRGQGRSTRRPVAWSLAAPLASCARAATASWSATGTTTTRPTASIDPQRWMHSGDLATMDDGGLCRHRRS